MKSQHSTLGASCPVSRWHYSPCWQMQRKQDVARGHGQPGSAWMQPDQVLQQHGSAAKTEGPAFSHEAWQVATYCSYFDKCLCLQLYSPPHFACKYMVWLLLLLMIKPGTSVCPASVALCSCHKFAIKPMELYQLLAAFGIKRNTGWLGCLVIQPGAGVGL